MMSQAVPWGTVSLCSGPLLLEVNMTHEHRNLGQNEMALFVLG